MKPVPWYPQAFTLTDPNKQQIFHPLYVNGGLYVQGLSSMIPALAMEPQPGEKILDLTAAPGSKTTQIAMMMQNSGFILANELSPIRIFKLQANLKQQGVTNATVRRGPGQYVWQKFPEYFDRTLVDVPCSMEGRFFSEDPKTYQEWTMLKVKRLAIQQQHLLRSAVTATRPGGVIIYSTCTLAPEENEAVIDWLLEKEQGKVILESISIPGLTTDAPIMEWMGKQFDPQLQNAIRILPRTDMEGFFIAKLRKLESNLPAPQAFSRRGR